MGNLVIHHMIPLSLAGVDWEENKMELTFEQHVELHQLLDINYRQIRRYRKRTNHFIWQPSQALIDETIHVHKKFFSNFTQLPIEVKKKHVLKMYELCVRSEREYGVYAPRPEVSGNLDKQFHTWLRFYHSILRLCCSMS